ncbi:polysaccharide pyruvyl transferase family protein [Cupriavidus lacunae]|uniref:Polysaccharide pyruvyl transferase domain-containing protein n=1 Tax=Cupriavidus lacunae TaxID=2666307 RepID=A0A370NY14_9BURK|nr:polysaccharide pyruvyl transferase family protein [Cupriavidus lacunae]RDK10482.1 hypothetical protein DN412_09490 [Cupriavidus lacunae]
MRNVILAGYFGRANIGDDALLKVSATHVRRALPGNTLCIERAAEYLRVLVPDVKLGVIAPSAKADEESNRITVYCGGTQFFQFKKATFGEKVQYWRGQARVSLKSTWKELSGVIKERVNPSRRGPSEKILVGIGVGPIATESYAASLISKLATAQDIWVRDKASLSFLADNGLRAKFGADICFSSEMLGILPSLEGLSPEREVTIICRDWSLDQCDVTRRLIELGRQLRARGLAVEFCLFSHAEDSVSESFILNAGFPLRKWGDDGWDITEFLKSTYRTKLVISARYHGAIFSALLGIPVCVVDIEPKLSELSTQSGGAISLLERTVGDETASNWCSKAIAKLDQTTEVVNSLRRFVCVERERADAMWKDVEERLRSSGGSNSILLSGV